MLREGEQGKHNTSNEVKFQPLPIIRRLPVQDRNGPEQSFGDPGLALIHLIFLQIPMVSGTPKALDQVDP